MNNQIKGVFFDLYGTLLVFDDFDGADNIWVNAFYNLIGKKNNLSPDIVQQICKEILEVDLERDSSNGLTTYETKIKKGFNKFKIDIPKDELRNLANETAAMWQVNIRLADDALFVLNEIKKDKTVALITNFDHSLHIRKVLAEVGLDDIFDFVVISDEAGCKKPEPEIFKLALQKTNLKPDEVIYIGDNIYDDIEGAFSAGIKPILICRNLKSHANCNNGLANSNKSSLPEFTTINSLSELIPLLN